MSLHFGEHGEHRSLGTSLPKGGDEPEFWLTSAFPGGESGVCPETKTETDLTSIRCSSSSLIMLNRILFTFLSNIKKLSQHNTFSLFG
jgi:hypothetical protein